MKFLFCLIFYLGAVPSYSQSHKIANYVPQSPEAASFFRYQEIPVDLSTGVPNIQVPIYTVKLDDIEIPITMTYHASGIKAADVSSEVGLGWNLNFGGNITCQIMDHPDFNNYQHPTYRTTADAIALSQSGAQPNSGSLGYDVGRKFWYDLTQRGASEPGLYDGTSDFFSDRFSFSLCTGESGVFRRDFVNSTIHFLPYSPVKVSNLQGHIIELKSGNGSVHTFKAANGLWDLYLPSEIKSSKNQKALYHYSKTFYSTQEGVATSLQWYNMTYEISGQRIIPSNGGYDLKNTKVYQNTISTVPDSITTEKEVIFFEYVKGRLDNPNYRLKQIIVRDRITREEVKRIVFRQSYFVATDGGSHRLRLDKIVSYSKDAQDSTQHRFEYNDIALPPYPNQNNGYTTFNDYWGYTSYAKQYQMPDDLIDFLGADFPGKQNLVALLGNFRPHPIQVKAALIDKIYYPTGGRVEFTFDANCDSGLIGGVRVSEIKTFDGLSSLPIVKTYRYHNPVYETIDGADYVKYPQTSNFAYYKVPNVVPSSLTYPTSHASGSSFGSKTNPNGTIVTFGLIEEMIGNGTSNIGKNVYYYDNFDPRLYAFANPAIIDIEPGNKSSYLCDYGNYKPKLDSVLRYANDPGTGFRLVRKEVNHYTNMKSLAFPVGLAVGSYNNIISIEGESTLYDAYDAFSGFPNVLGDYYSPSLIFCDAMGHEDNTVLTSKSVVDYSSNLPAAISSETYSYDNYLQVTEKIKSVRNGEIKKTLYKYPYTPDFITQEPYSKMVSLNKISPVVEEVEYKNGTFLNTIRTSYKNWANDIIEPEFVKTRKAGEANFDTRLQYHSYDDKGNVVSVSNEGGSKTSYLWGYKTTVPIVKAENVSSSDLYSSCYQVLVSLGLSYGIAGLDIYLQSLGDLTISSQRNSWRLFNERLRSKFTSISAITTYTYKPLVGMTSSTDARGQTTYYEYDNFQRLKAVKDANGNVLKATDYHYKP